MTHETSARPSVMISESIAGAVALRVATPDEHQQAGHQRGVDEDVRGVPERGERHLPAEQLR